MLNTDAYYFRIPDRVLHVTDLVVSKMAAFFVWNVRFQKTQLYL